MTCKVFLSESAQRDLDAFSQNITLGIPQDSRDAFTLLHTFGILPAELAIRMQHMVGFRNIAVYEYTRLNVDAVRSIITKQPDDVRLFSSTIVNALA